jgi:hypothetical protein
MKRTIFFSWQSDTPRNVGRGLIERALERAVGAIGVDSEVEEAVRDSLEVDRDTRGVSGSPPIVDTIFKKIDSAAVFVADLTFAGRRPDGAPIPNPNVLIEYGWALKALGHGRIVSVMNTAFGNPSDNEMPFDLRHLRHPIQYDCPASADETTRKTVRAALAKRLEGAIKTVVNSDEFKASLPQSPEAPRFKGKEALDGPGRFRPKGQSIGVSDHHVFLDTKGRDVTLTDGPAMWLRVMPVIAPARRWSTGELRKVSTSPPLLMPMHSTIGGYSYLRAEDGFGVHAVIEDHRDKTSWMVFAFTTGEVWAIDTYLPSAARDYIPINEKSLSKSLEEYASFLSRLGIEPPYRWIVGIEGVKGKGIYVPPPSGHMSSFQGPRGHCVVDPLVQEGTYSPGDDARTTLRLFFERGFDSCGLERPAWLNA